MRIFFLFILIITMFSGCGLNKLTPGYKTEQFKNTPVYELAKAAQNNNARRIKVLIKNKKFDLEYKSKLGYTVLMVAVFNSRYKAIEELLKNGADPNARDDIGRTILMIQSHGIITDYCNTRITELLIKYGADVNAICNFIKVLDPQNPEAGWGLYRTTALMEACESACMEKIKLLIAKGADPNKWVGNEGNCALTRAMIQNRMDVVKYLVTEVKVKIPPFSMILVGGDTLSVAGMLRLSYFKLGSRNHQLKMEVVQYLKNNYNLDYFKEPVPGGFFLERIKDEHPKDWEEFIQKY